MGCKHISCGNKEIIWLPFKYRGLECGLKPHQYCRNCGVVKIASSEKPKRLGYYINILTKFSEQWKITKVQIRLISMDLQRHGIDDIYSMDKYMQEKLFLQIIQKYVNLTEPSFRQLLKAFDT